MRRKREEEPKEATRPASVAAPAHPLLALQQSAGNRAVTGMLAREEAKAEQPRHAVEIEGIGRIPVVSFSFGQPRNVAGTGGQRGEAVQNEVTLQSTQGPHSPRLLTAVDRGTHWDKVVLEGGGARWTFTDAFAASYQAGGRRDEESPTESWTLMAAKMEFG